MKLACGIDFGTSNSAMGVFVEGEIKILPVEGTHPTLPTVLFYNSDKQIVQFGRAAIADYVDGVDGRFLRSLKSILGSSLAEEATLANGRRVPFLEIIATFLAHMRRQFIEIYGQEPCGVVLGRPVYFVDGNPEADCLAQKQLEKAAEIAGFRDIRFQLEPMAAALSFERSLRQEEVVLIADIGGGTSDFSVLRLARDGREVLAHGGVHIGGNDFDRLLCLKAVMPAFGSQSHTLAKNIPLPQDIFHDLSTWHKVHFLYNSKTLHALRQLRYDAAEPALLDRFIHLLEHRTGHFVSLEVEAAKIRLSEAAQTAVDLSFCEKGLQIPVTRSLFEQANRKLVIGIRQAIGQTLAQAGLEPSEIGRVVFTGGGAQIPMVREGIVSLFPQSKLHDVDAFQAVAEGLAMDAARQFQIN